MNKRLISYLIFYSLAFGIACPAPMIAMQGTVQEKTKFASFKEFQARLASYGTIAKGDAKFLWQWAKQKYNQKMRGGAPTTAEHDARARNILITKGIPLAFIMTIIAIGTIATGIGIASNVKKKRKETAQKEAAIAKEQKEAAERRKELKKPTTITIGTKNDFMTAIGSGKSLDEIKEIVRNYPLAPKAKDANNVTPLMVAIMAERFDIANYLLDQGAPTDIVNNNGFTALKIAQEFQKYYRSMSQNSRNDYYRAMYWTLANKFNDLEKRLQ